MKIIYQKVAMEELYKIYAYTADKWGLDKAESYVNGIYKTINLAAAKQKPWREYTGLQKVAERPIYFVSYQRHFVFFEVIKAENIMAIIAVLYEGMDVPNRMKNVIVSIGRDNIF